MNIDVKIYLTKNHNALLATASVCLNGCFIIRGVKVIEGSKTFFVYMPSRKVDGEYHAACYPCTKKFRQAFDQSVLDVYAEAATAASDKLGFAEKVSALNNYALVCCFDAKMVLSFA